MAKQLRGPLLGYNHNLSHLGRVFHVQSEDSGPGMPRVFTHLFFEGSILVSRKQEYDAGLPDDKVRALMQAQHKTVMKDLMQARLDERIIAFFAARGEELVPVQGAVPAAPRSETSGPMMMVSRVPTDDAELSAAAVATDVAVAATSDAAPITDFEPSDAASPAADAAGLPVLVSPRRTATRPIETLYRGPAPAPVLVRQPEARRPPFVRGGTPAGTKISSTDGVVVQRNVIVGGPSASSARPARIRPPIPYVVTGGGHTERPPQPAGSGSSTQSAPASAAVPVAANAGRPPQPVSGPDFATESSRPTGGFGMGLADEKDKSLDEVILEYLAEDGDAG
jgi:hypothetical protein